MPLPTGRRPQGRGARTSAAQSGIPGVHTRPFCAWEATPSRIPFGQDVPGDRAVPDPAHHAHPREGAGCLGAGPADGPAGGGADRAHRRHGGRGPRRPPGGPAGRVRRRPGRSGPGRDPLRPRVGRGRLAAAYACERRAGQRLRDGDRAGRAGARPLGVQQLHELPLRRGHRSRRASSTTRRRRPGRST